VDFPYSNAGKTASTVESLGVEILLLMDRWPESVKKKHISYNKYLNSIIDNDNDKNERLEHKTNQILKKEEGFESRWVTWIFQVHETIA